MKKKIIWSVVVVLAVVIIGFVFMSLSQDKSFPSLDKSSNTQPMYGASSYEEYAASRNAEMQKVDDDFVKGIVERKGSKKAAFEDAIKLAWSYLAKGDNDTAMKRCNQAWLIDHINFNVDWCYGAVLGSMDKNVDAVQYFDKAISGYSTALEIFPDDYLSLWRDAGRLFTVLSDEYLKKNDVENTKKYSEKAITLLSNFLKDQKAPKEMGPNVYSLLISTYLNNGDYQKGRTAYNELIKKYPEIKKEQITTEIDNALKEKGF